MAGCCKHRDSNFVSISGICNLTEVKNVRLLKVEHGTETEIANSTLNERNEYGLYFSPDKEGFYMLDGGRYWLPLYAKGNQQFSIDINSDGSYLQKQIPDEENKILNNWYHSNDTLNQFRWYWGTSKTYEDFFPFYESFIPKMKQQHELVISNNAYFNKLMHSYIDINIENIATAFVIVPRLKKPTKNDIPDFYDAIINEENFNSANVLDVPNGFYALRCHQNFKEEFTDFKYDGHKRNALTNEIKNDTLRAYYALHHLNKRNFASYNDAYLNYMKPLRSTIAQIDYLAQEVDKFEVSIKSLDPGVQGYEFTYEDVDGKVVSFIDFKGKYVYIDVWATWCGPCKREIPDLIELEKNYHDKNIVFVSVSMDNPKNKSKWKAFVKDKGLGGVQLISDDAFNTRVAKDYKIEGIPRFMLFDSEGKIIDANAKRPSDPELKKQLDRLL